MAKERIVRATFSNGYILERGSTTKVYSHAWRVAVVYTLDWRKERLKAGWFDRTGGTETGFATDAGKAQRAMRSVMTGWQRGKGCESVDGEVVAVEVIDKRSKAEAA